MNPFSNLSILICPPRRRSDPAFRPSPEGLPAGDLHTFRPSPELRPAAGLHTFPPAPALRPAAVCRTEASVPVLVPAPEPAAHILAAHTSAPP